MIAHDKALHVIAGALAYLVGAGIAHLIGKAPSTTVGIATAVSVGIAKELYDLILNARAMRQSTPAPHSVDVKDALATCFGGLGMWCAAMLGSTGT